MKGPVGSGILLIGCPKCACNGLIEHKDTPFSVEDNLVNTATDVECPHGCGAVFSVEDNEIVWR
jgi:hypothetical protein